MASEVAVCISIYRPTFLQVSEEMASERKHSTSLAFSIFSSCRTSRPGAKLHIISPSGKGRLTVSSGFDHLTASSRHRCVTLSNFLDPISNVGVLYGYWVGPDIEDGWGYIEAFVTRTF